MGAPAVCAASYSVLIRSVLCVCVWCVSPLASSCVGVWEREGESGEKEGVLCVREPTALVGGPVKGWISTTKGRRWTGKIWTRNDCECCLCCLCFVCSSDAVLWAILFLVWQQKRRTRIIHNGECTAVRPASVTSSLCSAPAMSSPTYVHTSQHWAM